MTSEQINLVQDRFRNVTPNLDEIADLFYGRLFDLEPQLRPLFPEDMGGQKKKFTQLSTKQSVSDFMTLKTI